MASDHFYLFTALATFSSELQQKLRRVQSADEIVLIAAEHGYAITLQQLRHYASRLNGDHWVWFQKGDAWREQFLEHQRAGAAA